MPDVLTESPLLVLKRCDVKPQSKEESCCDKLRKCNPMDLLVEPCDVDSHLIPKLSIKCSEESTSAHQTSIFQTETPDNLSEFLDEHELIENLSVDSQLGINLESLNRDTFSEVVSDFCDENTSQLRFSPCAVKENTRFNELNELHNPYVKISDCKLSVITENCFTTSMLEGTLTSPFLNTTFRNKAHVTNTSVCKNTKSSKTCHLPSIVEDCSLDADISSFIDTKQTSSFSSLPCESDTTDGYKLNSRKRHYSGDSECTSVKQHKKSTKKSVTFNGVTIFYFPRKQSFVTVPSKGGSTLGMSLKHCDSKDLSLDQHISMVERHRRKAVKEFKRQEKLYDQLQQLKRSNPDLDSNQLMSIIANAHGEENSPHLFEDESDDDCTNACGKHDEEDFDNDEYYLQPIPPKKRKILLRSAGVENIDSEEKFENKRTRASRARCGCDCVGVCLPASCQCALAGIPCQADRDSFPCGCAESGCHNASGRVAFDANRVKGHHIRTMTKLRLEETGCSSQPIAVDTTYQNQSTQSPYVLSMINEKAANTSASPPPSTVPLQELSLQPTVQLNLMSSNTVHSFSTLPHTSKSSCYTNVSITNPPTYNNGFTQQNTDLPSSWCDFTNVTEEKYQELSLSNESSSRCLSNSWPTAEAASSNQTTKPTPYNSTKYFSAHLDRTAAARNHSFPLEQPTFQDVLGNCKPFVKLDPISSFLRHSRSSTTSIFSKDLNVIDFTVSSTKVQS